MLEKMATFQSRGSGWKLYIIIQLEIYTVGYNPTSGEAYIPLPKALGNKKSIIDMKNKDDNKCFYGVFLVRYILNITIRKELINIFKRERKYHKYERNRVSCTFKIFR